MMLIRRATFCMVLLGLLAACDRSPTGIEPEPEPEPEPPPVLFTSVTAGAAHTCALAAEGRPWCWGRGGTGALGLDTLASTPLPLPVATLFRFSSISAGVDHTCATTPAGEAYCWGQGSWGKLGTGNTREALRPVLVASAGDVLFSSIRAGGEHTCGLTSTRLIYCWGKGSAGEMGTGILEDRSRPALPVAVRDTFHYTALSSGRHHACALDVQGSALCWGWGHFGQLGLGSNVTIGLPERVPGLRFAAISAGREHTCGLTTDGIAYCWGRGDFGQLGDGVATQRTSPARVSGNQVFSTISAGGEHTCALTADGAAYCWGEASRGRLGEGSTAARSQATPVAVAGGLRFRSIAAGGQHTCAVTEQGEVYCWGFGGFGQLGNGGVTDHPSSVRVTAPRQAPAPAR
jgi:alpha-tubulin suppressor-like RCC1 family protein